MINRLIGGFIAILIGVSLVGPLATQVTSSTATTNSSGSTCTSTAIAGCTGTGTALYISSSWGATVLNMVPGFFALGILGVGIAVTYGSLRDAGVV